MAVEAKRGCGYRKVGGLYLVGTSTGVPCDRLPIELTVCRCCGQGIKQTRGFTWVDIAALVGGDHFTAPHLPPAVVETDGHAFLADLAATTVQETVPCGCPQYCPLCHNVASMGRGGLLWIGTQFYATVDAFEAEAKLLGISRRITTLPRGFELGKTWLLFAHPKGIIKTTGDLTSQYVPAIFRVWKPERIERIYTESQRDSEAVQADIKRGITPVYVPDNDKDHQGSVYDKLETADEAPTQTPGLFNS